MRLITAAALLAALVSLPAHALTMAECSAAFDPDHPNKVVFNQCADVAERVLKENACTRLNPGGVYTAAVNAWKKASEGRLITVPFSWEIAIRDLIVARKNRC
jgi:hypothetical protein